MARLRLFVLIFVSCVLFVARASNDEATAETTPTAESEESPVESEEPAGEEDGALRSADEFDPSRPPPVEVVQGEDVIPIAADGYCWGDECATADEVLLDELIVATTVDDEIRFRFPVDGWRFSAFVSDGGTGQSEIDVESLGDGEFAVILTDPTQPVVDLFGQGPTPGGFGDVGVTFLFE